MNSDCETFWRFHLPKTNQGWAGMTSMSSRLWTGMFGKGREGKKGIVSGTGIPAHPCTELHNAQMNLTSRFKRLRWSRPFSHTLRIILYTPSYELTVDQTDQVFLTSPRTSGPGFIIFTNTITVSISIMINISIPVSLLSDWQKLGDSRLVNLEDTDRTSDTGHWRASRADLSLVRRRVMSTTVMMAG